ncbi:MAG: signal peptidase I [Algisphaera sp.]
MSELETPAPAAATAAPNAHPRRHRPPAQNPGLWKGWIRPFLVVILVVTALRSSLVDWNDVPTGSMIPTIAIGDRIVVNKLAYGFNPPFNGPKLTIPLVNIEWDNPADTLPGFYWSSPKRSDIVTFWKPSTQQLVYEAAKRKGLAEAEARDISAASKYSGGTRMIKRVVAIAGDVISMKPATLDHNGKPYRYSSLTLNDETATYHFDDHDQLVETLLGDTRIIRYIRNPDIRRLDEVKNGPPSAWAVTFGPFTVPEGRCLMIGDNRDNSADGRQFGPVEISQITGKAKFVAASFDGSFLSPVWSRFFKSLNF